MKFFILVLKNIRPPENSYRYSSLKRNRIISFLATIIITAFISSLVLLGFALLTFNLAGGETLKEIEVHQAGYLILSILLLVVAAICAKGYLKTNKSAAYGILIVPTLISIVAIINFVAENVYSAKFDSVAWKQEKWKPESMAKGLVKNKSLLGMGRGQVKQMLGPGAEEYGEENSDRGALIYTVKNHWTLSIYFQNNKVVEVTMRKPSMMTINAIDGNYSSYRL